MRNIQICDDASLELYDDKLHELPREAVIIVPYRPIQALMIIPQEGAGMVNVNYDGLADRIAVFHCGVLSYMVFKDGQRLSDGHVSVAFPIKDFELASDQDAQNQIEGYLALAEWNENIWEPFAVGQVTSNGKPITAVMHSALLKYGAEWLSQEERLPEYLRPGAIMSGIEEIARDSPSLMETGVEWRYYYGASEEFQRTFHDFTTKPHKHAFVFEMPQNVVAR